MKFAEQSSAEGESSGWGEGYVLEGDGMANLPSSEVEGVRQVKMNAQRTL
jgi:hypothetical protein